MSRQKSCIFPKSIIILCFIVLLSPGLHAQDELIPPMQTDCTVQAAKTDTLATKKKGKHRLKRKDRKTLRELLGTADSLRLRLRHAADQGHMLQWADTLMRQRLHRGEVDSAKYGRLMMRLRKVDRQLFRGDSLLARNYRKVSFDTAYIARPDGRWTVKLRTNISGAKLETVAAGGTERRETEVRSEYRGTVSVAVAYRGLGLGLALNPAKLAGKNKDYEFNLNSYSNRYGFDVIYMESNTYHGTQTVGSQRYDVDKGSISQKALNVNFYYAFNGRRFSMPAAFTQSYIQKRSAGSFMLGMSFDGQLTDISKDAGISDTDTKLKVMEFGIGAGYGYNLVVNRRLLLHLDALPTFNVLAKSEITGGNDKLKLDYQFPSVIITGRGAAIYSWRNKFAGLTMVFNYSTFGKEDHLQLGRDKWRLRGFFGFRF